MKLFVIALAVLLFNMGVVSGTHAAAQQPKKRQVSHNGRKVDYSLVNLETMCASRQWRECHTDLSPTKYRK